MINDITIPTNWEADADWASSFDVRDGTQGKYIMYVTKKLGEYFTRHEDRIPTELPIIISHESIHLILWKICGIKECFQYDSVHSQKGYEFNKHKERDKLNKIRILINKDKKIKVR